MTRQLGSRYVLDAVIGKGASGQVWRGHDSDGNPLAFKILRDSIADDADSVARFVQERNILTSLDHPNLVRVRGMVVEDNTLALVMDLVEGGDLRSYLSSHGTLSSEEACTLAAGIADGLASIHDAGILHRDIKPENVLLDFRTGQPIPKITDFSIARIVSSAKTSTMMAGTPTYIAPELFDDTSPTVQSDLYSLGIVLYELVAGSPPFRSDSLLTMMKLHSTEPPSRPANCDDRTWEILARLLSKDPSDRLPDAHVTAAALRSPTPFDLPQPTSQRDGAAVTVRRPQPVHASKPAETRVPSHTPRPASPPPPEWVPPTPPTTRAVPVRMVWAGIGLALVLLAVIVVAVSTVSREPRTVPVTTSFHKKSGSDIVLVRDGALSLLSSQTGNLTTMLDGDTDESPSWSPDRKQVVFSRVFDGVGDIYVAATDGSGAMPLTEGPGDDRAPSWSRDGSHIVFARDGNITSMAKDGTDLSTLTSTAEEDRDPEWSPDGSQIVFARVGNGDGDLNVMDADGSNMQALTNGPADDRDPEWSKDGSEILFVRLNHDADNTHGQILLTNAHGTGITALTSSSSDNRDPGWSADGRKIVFTKVLGDQGDIWVMRGDGSDPQSLTSGPSDDRDPSWFGSDS